jgi:hypothetical protein
LFALEICFSSFASLNSYVEAIISPVRPNTTSDLDFLPVVFGW